MAPELSLATIGGLIAVIEVPGDVPLPHIKEVAYLMTLIGQMVVQREAPKETLAGLGDQTKTIPNIYRKGKDALAHCVQLLHQQSNDQMI